MLRILVQTGKAVSICEVARQIAQVCEKRGHIVTLNRQMLTTHTLKGLFDAAIFVYPVAPAWCTKWFYYYSKAVKEIGRAVYYTTTEGRIKRWLIHDWVRRDCEFVACSNYVASKLREVGLRVRAVVHHAAHVDDHEQVEKLAEQYRKLLQSRFGDLVFFACVSDLSFRKGLDKLVEAVKLLLTKRRDFAILLHTKPDVLKMIQGTPHIVLVGEFGTRDHDEVMAFYRACHYLVFPTLAEGFGLPLLEANFMSRPAVVTKLPVFSEYADMEHNIPVETHSIQLFDNEDGVLYELHQYDVRELASALDYAIDLVKSKKSEYEDRCVKVREKVKDMTSDRLYTKILELVGG